MAAGVDVIRVCQADKINALDSERCEDMAQGLQCRAAASASVVQAQAQASSASCQLSLHCSF